MIIDRPSGRRMRGLGARSMELVLGDLGSRASRGGR